MTSYRPPISGFLYFHVHGNGNVYVRYGGAYDIIDPEHKDNHWVKYFARSLEERAKAFIASSHTEANKSEVKP